MSERGEVEVLLPVSRPPTRVEMGGLLQVAVKEARHLVAPLGWVLALVGVRRAESPAGELALKMRFLVEAPETVLERGRKVFTVNGVSKGA